MFSRYFSNGPVDFLNMMDLYRQLKLSDVKTKITKSESDVKSDFDLNSEFESKCDYQIDPEFEKESPSIFDENAITGNMILLAGKFITVKRLKIITRLLKIGAPINTLRLNFDLDHYKSAEINVLYELFDAIRLSMTMDKFEFVYKGLRDVSFANRMAAMIPTCNLTKLRLHTNCVEPLPSPTPFAAIINALRTDLNITTLDVSFCGLGDSGAIELVNMLSENKSIVEITATNNGITDIGATELLNSLSCGNLKRLNIKDTTIHESLCNNVISKSILNQISQINELTDEADRKHNCVMRRR